MSRHTVCFGLYVEVCTGCMTPEVITALSSVAARNLLPITCRRPLEGTLAAAFVLCQRANLASSHVATKPEVLLAVLWILEQYNRHAFPALVKICSVEKYSICHIVSYLPGAG